MKKRIVFENNMEALAEDENALQGYVQDYNDTLFLDWLQARGKKAYAGFSTSRKSATVLTVGSGRLYANMMFDREDAGDVDLAPHLPAAAKRVVAIVLYGETIQARQTERDYLIDPAGDEMQPRSVYLERHRVARVSVVPGVEGAAPAAPVIDSGVTLLATVTLTTAGYASASAISRAEDNEIKNLSALYALVDAQALKNRKQDQVLDGLRSDIEEFEKRIKGTTSQKALLELAADIARIKEIIGLPETRSSYGADRFLDAEESDKTRAGFDALVNEGLRFPPANISEVQLALQDTFDASVELTANGMIFPRNRDKTVISIGDVKAERTGEIAMANYATVTFAARQLRLARARIRYGEEFRVSTSSRWWDSGRYDPIANVFRKDGEVFEVVQDGIESYRYTRLKRYWVDFWNDDEYWPYTSTALNITGKVVYQNYLNSSSRWIKAVRFRCTRKGAAGDVSVVITRTVNGKAQPDEVLAFATMPYADVTEGGWLRINVEPFILRRGDRVAIHLVTAGDHWFQTADGDDYAEGTMFAYQDSDFAESIPGRTLCFELIQAEFLTTRTVAALQPWSLDGGIASIDILAGSTHRRAGSLYFEIKIAGKWRRIDDPKNGLTALASVNPLPPLVEARVVMTHTTNFAPALVLAGSRVRLTRPKTALRRFSKPIALPSASSSIRLQHEISDWNAAASHAFTAKLLTGAGYATANTGAQTITSLGGSRRRITTVFSLGASVTSFVIQEDGATATAADVFVGDEMVFVSF